MVECGVRRLVCLCALWGDPIFTIWRDFSACSHIRGMYAEFIPYSHPLYLSVIIVFHQFNNNLRTKTTRYSLSVSTHEILESKQLTTPHKIKPITTLQIPHIPRTPLHHPTLSVPAISLAQPKHPPPKLILLHRPPISNHHLPIPFRQDKCS